VYSIQNKNDVYIGVTSQRFEERVKGHLKPNNPTNAKRIARLHDTKFNQLTEYIYTADQVKQGKEKEFVIKFQKMGFNILNNPKYLGNIGHSRIKWTESKLQAEALKYSGRYEFQKGSASAYQSALRRGLVEKICQHMPPKQEYWTRGRILHAVSLYNSFKEIREKKSYLHKIIYERNLQNEVKNILNKKTNKSNKEK
jgi:GIY-YIG catalytic domain.